MLNKISENLLKMQIKAAEILQSLKNDERGLSGVVVAILLILIAVLAIVLIWGFLGNWLEELWIRITQEAVIE